MASVFVVRTCHLARQRHASGERSQARADYCVRLLRGSCGLCIHAHRVGQHTGHVQTFALPAFAAAGGCVLAVGGLGVLQDVARDDLLANAHIKYLLIHGTGANQAIDRHWLLLTYPMTAILRLTIDLRVEVHVVQDYRVCRRQVDALTACSSAQQEDG
eukprot:scaffold1090_cov265-Pinguiococcus_pyrenoidosus.AAC.7